MLASKPTNIIDFSSIKQQVVAKKRLEMIMRDSLDNMEDYGFQFYYASNMDMLGEYEILPYYEYEPSQTDNIQARA